MNLMHHLIILSAFLFTIGLVITIVKQHAIMILLGIELMLNAANLNLVVFNNLKPELFAGQMFAIFIIIVAVCESAVGMAIILRVYKNYHTAIPDSLTQLKDS